MFKRSRAFNAVTASFSNEYGGNLFIVKVSLGESSPVPKHPRIGPIECQDAIVSEFAIPILNYVTNKRL